jgi:hypothetical protein
MRDLKHQVQGANTYRHTSSADYDNPGQLPVDLTDIESKPSIHHSLNDSTVSWGPAPFDLRRSIEAAMEEFEQLLIRNPLQNSTTNSSDEYSAALQRRSAHIEHARHFITAVRPEALLFGRWFAVMRHYALRGEKSDWAVVEALFFAFRHSLTANRCSVQPIPQLIQYLLAEDPGCASVREILFPTDSRWGDRSGVAGGEDSPSKVNVMAVAYLNFFCSLHQDAATQIQETVTVINIAKASKVLLTEELVIPLLRSLCSSGRVTKARTFMEKAKGMYDITVTFDTMEVFVNGYCDTSQWEEALQMLEEIHMIGYVRRQPERYTVLCGKVIDRISTEFKVERCFGMVVHMLKNTGLIPDGKISRAVVSACIREGNYSLIREWSRLVRNAYERIALSYKSLETARKVTDIWSEIGATCQEMASACT